MNYFFLDTTSDLKIGILDDSYNWLVFEHLKIAKPSEVIHTKIFHLAQNHKIDIKKSGLIYIAGPGSYTGMRLSEGIVETFKLNNIPVFGLYQYQIPQFSEIKSGKWICDAFKSQYFIYEWNNETSNSFLINKNQFVVEENFFFSDSTLNIKGTNVDTFLKNNSKSIFKKVVDEKLQARPHYFRDLEVEFVPSC